MLHQEDFDEVRPALPDWFLSNFVATRERLETIQPWISLRDSGDDVTSEDRNSLPGTTSRSTQESSVYEIDPRVYSNLLALARPVQNSFQSPTSRFQHDVLALKLPGQTKQPPGLDFLVAVAKRIARDIGADFIQLDYDILQSIKPSYLTTSGKDHELSQRPLLRQGVVEKPVLSTTKFKWVDYFHEILSTPRTSIPKRLEARCSDPRALVIVFTDPWGDSEDGVEKEQQEKILRAFKQSLRSSATREYPVLIVTTDIPGLSKDDSQVDDRYDLMDQLGQRPLHEPIEICPVSSQTQRQLLKRDQERKVARDNIRRIQLYAKRSPICNSSELLDPPNDWDFLKSSSDYKVLSDPDLSNNQVASIASQLRVDCSEESVRRVVASALSWSKCLSSWTNERESKKAEELNVDEIDRATDDKSQDTASQRLNKIRDVIERIKKDQAEFEWENHLIDSIVEPTDMTCTWDDIKIDEARRLYIKRLVSHNFSRTKPYGVLKSGGIRGALLYGPPGTGKTHLARILARESNVAMIYVSAAELQSCWVGQTEKIVKALFRLGRMLFPSIVFLDESEAFLKARGKRDQRWEISEVNQFLREADGLVSRKSSPFLLLATNNPVVLDKAVLRRVPGTLYIGPPSLQSRQEIFRIILRDEEMDSSVDLFGLAHRTHRYSGSDIKTVCFNAASTCQMDLDISASELDEKDQLPTRILTMAHFEEALKLTSPTVTESVMEPLSEFASEFDKSAFAEMQAFDNEESEILHKRLKESRFTQPSGKGVQTPLDEVVVEAAATISSNGTATVTKEEKSVNELRLESSGSREGDSTNAPGVSFPHYLPLNSSTDEIRLLKIFNPEDLEKGGPTLCSLHSVSLKDSPPFTALSYVWGDSALTEEVWVDDKRVQVRAGLAAALRWTPYHWLRNFPGRPVTELWIWADALCIDQRNLLERNHQVAIMGEIYKQAELVVASIASERPRIRLAFEIYRDIHATLFSRQHRPSIDDLVHRRWLLKVPAIENTAGGHSAHAIQPSWRALHEFVALPYWSRVWIIQEIFLARRVLLICDFEALDFTYISEISSLLGLHEIRFGYEEYARMQGEFGNSRIGSRLCCSQCYDTIRRPAPILDIYDSKTNGTKHRVGTPGIQITLLRMTVKLQASDPRDVVYGLLGLSNLSVDVDYGQTIGNVFSQYVQHWITMLTASRESNQDEVQEAQASLGFTYCLALAGSARAAHAKWEQKGAMSPSWVPKFCTLLPASRFKPEDLSTGGDAWKLSHIFGPKLEIHLDYPVLGIGGFRLDSVERSTELSEDSDGSLRRSAWDRIRNLVLKRSPYVTGIPPLQALIRVLTRCLRDATLPFCCNSHAQETIIESTAIMERWLLPRNGAGVRRPAVRLLDPEFHSPLTPVDGASNLYRWIAQKAWPDTPELAQNLPDYFDDWDHSHEKLVREIPYSNAALLELKGCFLGLGPNSATDEDIVCVLQGCRQPVVLRRDGDHYTLVGTCYVLGLMRWEEVERMVRKDGLSQETFNIR